MISDLVRYIEEAKKKGFALEEIRHHLVHHGWNDYLVEYALRQVEARNDRKWLQGSLMAIVAIFLVTASTVWWWETGNPRYACLSESILGTLNVESNPSDCCAQIKGLPCKHLVDGPVVMDGGGARIFQAVASCQSSTENILLSQSTLSACRSNNLFFKS